MRWEAPEEDGWGGHRRYTNYSLPISLIPEGLRDFPHLYGVGSPVVRTGWTAALKCRGFSVCLKWHIE